METARTRSLSIFACEWLGMFWLSGEVQLEAMAYDAETAFASSMAIFDVEKMVAAKLGL